ncbi:hypothetical protein M758_4G193700 [Ceratodon purpureus]|uniref:Uncharacterized protein n=1 Tax=Ceratodon purpureus TaxID=3225 RepID=A0A8T0ICL0_CERPU|nr:hypothetical protein KC19_4G190700 [Ceratodon purpureus]KAG0620156.1 hypothetical protein M758_4G193700 [Ceratodon purpureus]
MLLSFLSTKSCYSPHTVRLQHKKALENIGFLPGHRKGHNARNDLIMHNTTTTDKNSSTESTNNATRSPDWKVRVFGDGTIISMDSVVAQPPTKRFCASRPSTPELKTY